VGGKKQKKPQNIVHGTTNVREREGRNIFTSEEEKRENSILE
jgi:hypothetical protein